MRPCWRTLAAAIGVVALLAAPAGARERTRGTLVVQDLAYGEVLFHFFKEDYFTALTRLLAAQDRGELRHHHADAELMLGGLYLSYGQHRLAGEVFERVLEQSVAPELHDRAWFFLAKIWHQRGYLAEAEAALARVAAALPADLEPQRQMLSAQILMDQSRFADALAVLDAWREPGEEWIGYAKYNIGVSLVRLGQVEQGARVLEEVGRLDGENPALASLRDKANVALGYAWLQAGAPAAAKPPLQRVRLDGPFSSKALLGVGWADAETARYEAALAPWLVLKERDLLDSAVQETLLAVPYAFAQLGADRQAAEHYEAAIAAYTEEMERLSGSIVAIEEGRLLAELLGEVGELAESVGWYWRLERLPDTIESRYLYELLASHEFQEGLKNYRDLLQLARNLERWADSLEAFDGIVDTRERAYRERLANVDASLATVHIDELHARRSGLEAQLLAIERSEDVVALGTPEQRENWARLTAMEPKLALFADDPAVDELRYKQRFLKGLLLWDLRRDYKARLWAQKRELSELDRLLREAQRRDQVVRSARDEWPQQHAELVSRIEVLKPRVDALRGAVETQLARQRSHLQGIAVARLESQRERLRSYTLQARFALASIYDRAASRTAAASGPRVEGAP